MEIITFIFRQINFILIYLRSTNINHCTPTSYSRWNPFQWGLRGESSQTYLFILNAKQGSIGYHFYNVFGMTWSGIEPTTSCSQGKRSITEPYWVWAINGGQKPPTYQNTFLEHAKGQRAHSSSKTFLKVKSN